MRILVTGSSGQLGSDVIEEACSRNHEVIGIDKESSEGLPTFYKSDITDKNQIIEIIIHCRPDAVIHCAAWTAVEAAEDPANRKKVYDVNARATGYIAEACNKLDCPMMYVSTDYVFDGKGEDPRDPDDTDFDPLNYYGESKLEGEKAIGKKLDRSFIVRTSWLYGQNGDNFVKTMIDLGQTHEKVRVVDDQIGTPTYTPDLARLLVDMIETDRYGCYHASNEGGYISWYDFACEIYRQTGSDTTVIPVSTEEYGLSRANRPKNSRLCKTKLCDNGFDLLPTWQDALNRFLLSDKTSGNQLETPLEE